MEKIEIITLIILFSIIFASGYIYAADITMMLSPKIVSGQNSPLESIFSQDKMEKILMNSSEQNVWKPLLSFYVHEFGKAAVPFLKAKANKITEDKKKNLFLRAAVIAGEAKELNAQEQDDSFASFVLSLKKQIRQTDMTALDIGSGDGSFLRQVQCYPWSKDIKFIGVDNSQDMIDAAFYLNLMYVEKMDARSLVYKPDKFGLIFLNYPNPGFGLKALQECMQEAYRVMATGGGMVFTSCDDINNGFAPELIIKELIAAGFDPRSLEIIHAHEMPQALPVSGSAKQMLKRKPYLIMARKNKIIQEDEKVNLFKKNYPTSSNHILSTIIGIEQSI